MNHLDAVLNPDLWSGIEWHPHYSGFHRNILLTTLDVVTLYWMFWNNDIVNMLHDISLKYNGWMDQEIFTCLRIFFSVNLVKENLKIMI